MGGIIIPPAARRCAALPLPPEGLSTGRFVGGEGLSFPPRPRMPRVFLSASNTARAEGGGIQGGPPPCAGGPGTRRFLAYLSQHLCCYFPLREKVGRGMGRSAHTRVERRGGPQPSSHIVGRRGPRPCSSSPGGTQYPLHLYPEKPKKLHPNVQPNRKKNKKRGGPPRADGESLFACCV